MSLGAWSSVSMSNGTIKKSNLQFWILMTGANMVRMKLNVSLGEKISFFGTKLFSSISFKSSRSLSVPRSRLS